VSENITRIQASTGKPESWRANLRRIVPQDALWRIILELAEGRAYRPILPDGTEGLPIVPSPEIRLRAATDLADRLYGKAVSATEQIAAEREAGELETIRALSDSELEERARNALERGLARLDARSCAIEDAAQWAWGGQWEDQDPIDSNPPPVES
jgi:hypothetical protein